MAAHAHQRATREPRVFFARMADPTQIPDDPDKDDVSMHSWHAMAVTSQLTRQHNGTHQPRHQPRAKLS